MLKESKNIAKVVDIAIKVVKNGSKIHYFGAGTSGRLGILDAAELLPTFGVGNLIYGHIAGGSSALVIPVEGAEDSENLAVNDAKNDKSIKDFTGVNIPPVKKGDFVIGIAASGRTPYVKGVLKYAKKIGAKTALISTNPKATLKNLADVSIVPFVGNEVVTGSTRMKSGTAQKLVLNTFSTALMIRLGKTYSNFMIEVMPTNEKLKGRVVRLLMQATGTYKNAALQALKNSNNNVKIALISVLSNVNNVEKIKETLEICKKK